MIREDCIMDIQETPDQQLLRLYGCGGDDPFLQREVLYQLPQTALPVNAPLDATAIEPGKPITLDPAPATTMQTATTTVAETTTTTGGAAEWVKKNPLLVGAGVLLVAMLLSKKRKK